MAEEEKAPAPSPPQAFIMRSAGGGILPLVVGGVVAGAIIGGVVWFVMRGGVEDLTYFDISVEIVDPVLPRGGVAEVEVTITNKSESVQSPILRLDMWGTGIFESPIEGAPQSVGALQPGETANVIISYTLPGDWGPGKQLNAQLILLGVSGPVWTASAAFAIQSDTGDTGILEIVSVRAVNPSLVVGKVQQAQVEVIVNNSTQSNLLRTFRLDLIAENKLTPYEGQDKLISLPAGEPTTFTLSCNVPMDWTEQQSPVAAKIQNIGEEGPFWGDVGGSEEFEIFTLLNEGADFQDTENLIMTSKTPASGLLSNGQAFSVTMNVIYKGGGAFLFGAGLKDGSEDGVWATANALLPSSSDWATVSVTMTGVFYSTLGSGRSIDMIKAVQKVGGDLNIGGGGMIKADWDRDVFKVA
ncbi:MAG: hypothetical protein PHO67_08090 [Candidatus Omnitrophica bacterium]|nr:hypothetical protein [Candidatus Omnitrophota bacterium]